MRKRFITLPATLFLALLVACSGDSTSPATPSPASTTPPQPAATTTTTRTPPPTRTSTPSPTTTPSNIDAIFCAVERDGRFGFLRHGDPEPAECSDNGFVIGWPAEDVDAQLPLGAFVPRCFQLRGDEGVEVVVGELCVQSTPYSTLTTDPRPPELRDHLADGDLIPWCTFDHDAYPDYPITVGPPCIIGGEGPLRIALDEAPIQAAANCTAGFTYLSRSETTFRQLLDALPTSDQPTSFDAYRNELTPARDALAEAAPERVRQYFALWTDELSPISINFRIVEALDALASDSSPVAIEESRQQLDDALAWYTAGRGC